MIALMRFGVTVIWILRKKYSQNLVIRSHSNKLFHFINYNLYLVQNSFPRVPVGLIRVFDSLLEFNHKNIYILRPETITTVLLNSRGIIWKLQRGKEIERGNIVTALQTSLWLRTGIFIWYYLVSHSATPKWPACCDAKRPFYHVTYKKRSWTIKNWFSLHLESLQNSIIVVYGLYV